MGKEKAHELRTKKKEELVGKVEELKKELSEVCGVWWCVILFCVGALVGLYIYGLCSELVKLDAIQIQCNVCRFVLLLLLLPPSLPSRLQLFLFILLLLQSYTR